MNLGPNVKKLIFRKVSIEAVPANGGLADALGFLTAPGRLVETTRDATKWVEMAIAAVKAAPDNHWGDDDEAIAGEILRQAEERKRGQ